MSYEVEIAPAARKQIRKLSQKTQKRIVRRLEELEFNPRPAGTEKLAGSRDLYRSRVGDYRIIYRIEDAVLLVLVLKVGNRKEVYRNLPS